MGVEEDVSVLVRRVDVDHGRCARVKRRRADCIFNK